MRTRLVSLSLLSVVALVASGCSSETTPQAPPKKAALVIAQGGLGDESYNDLAMSGFTAATKEKGVEGQHIESSDVVAQGEQLLRRAGTSGYGLVIDLEFSHGEILPTIAAAYPNVQWAFLNNKIDGPNITSVLFAEHDGSYLAGALAAMMTTQTGNPKINADKKIGVIGGTKSVGIDKFLSGYIQGAKDVDQSIEVLTAYSNAFGDPTKGSQLAETMFQQGADIVYHVAGGTGAGVIEAAKKNNRYAIGVDDNQDKLAPGFVLTSVLKRADLGVRRVVDAYGDNKPLGGQVINLGLADGAVGLTDFEFTKNEIPETVRAKVDELKQKIISGQLKVWNVIDQGYPAWLQG
ncbi:BMP family ABC transporter substrate-binding protein [Kibdelosporangium aridum]|uniref:BMP family ABC transporter substrate-binding protein n=1 Tax=Kibdelosporangium aridum TaxID=2030 RepID=A0A428YPD1_KIBAR|nr:BMP family ABC transporter substrate-binding protein [Kibdelosporangium aridum]RSM70275.1 BMP family ABC transporter substrate-binding protein [Kibdelosporangium aridum]